MNLKTLLMLKAASADAPVLVEDTATGNPATFETDVKKALTGLTIPFTPKQAGSGDASPTNVREISGFDSITISRSGEDTSNPDTFTVAFGNAGTIYGGELNAITGVLTVTMAYREFNGSEAWGGDNTPRQQFVIQWSDVANAQIDGKSVIACNMAPPANYGYSDTPPYGSVYNTRGAAYNIRTHIVEEDMTLAQFKELLAENPLELVCPLATPYTVQLDPVTVKTLVGKNNVWSNTNGTNIVKYMKKA